MAQTLRCTADDCRESVRTSILEYAVNLAAAEGEADAADEQLLTLSELLSEKIVLDLMKAQQATRKSKKKSGKSGWKQWKSKNEPKPSSPKCVKKEL